MQYTLSEAARQVGCSKGTMSKAVASGRVSATRQPDGRFRIDAAELARVFPPKPGNASERGSLLRSNAGGNAVSVASKTAIAAEVRLLREMLERQDRELARRDEELARRDERIAELQREKEQERRERDRLIGLLEGAQRQLTDQRAYPVESASEQPSLDPPRRRWGFRLFRY